MSSDSNQASLKKATLLEDRLNSAMLVHDLKDPPSTCVNCKLAYPVAKRLERRGIFFPCSKHFTCWYCAEYLLTQLQESETSQHEFLCPGPKCQEAILMIEANVRIHGVKCIECSNVTLPFGNRAPVNVMGCPECFRCERCSIVTAKRMLAANPSKILLKCPTHACATVVQREKVEILAQWRCAVCKIANLTEPRKLSYCGNTSHYVCESCITSHLSQEAAKPFDAMADVVECPGGNGCVISRALVQQEIGLKCRQCKSRSKHFEVSECRSTCDECMVKWITTFTSDNNNHIREIPCPVHPKREECRIGQQWIEKIAGKICLVCLERKPIEQIQRPCEEHFVCQDCMRTYCQQQMRDNMNAFSFRCPGSNQCSCRIYYKHIQEAVGEEQFVRWQQHKIDTGLKLICQSTRCKRFNREMTVISSVEAECEYCGRKTCLVCRSRSRKAHQCKLKQEAEFLEYVKNPLNEVRPCIQCLRFIHREQGCNHMTCYGALGCGAEFCWVCLKPMNTVHVRCPFLSFGGAGNTNVELGNAGKLSQRRHLIFPFPRWTKKLTSLRSCKSNTVIVASDVPRAFS